MSNIEPTVEQLKSVIEDLHTQIEQLEAQAAQTVAEALTEQLIKSGAKNYKGSVFSLRIPGLPDQDVCVTVQFVNGKSPFELREEAEQRADEMYAALNVAGATINTHVRIGSLNLVNAKKVNAVQDMISNALSKHDKARGMSKPDDPGYIATRETWLFQADRTIVKLRRESFFYGVVAAVSLALLLGKCLA